MSSRNKWCKTIVNDIAGIIDVDINFFDIENVYRKLSNRNLEAPQIVVEFSSSKKEEFIRKRGKIEFKGSRIYINESLTALGDQIKSKRSWIPIHLDKEWQNLLQKRRDDQKDTNKKYR